MGQTQSVEPACDLNAFGLTPSATAYVLHIAFGLLLISTALRYKSTLGWLTSAAFFCAGAAAIVLQRGILDVRTNAGFANVLAEAQR